MRWVELLSMAHVLLQIMDEFVQAVMARWPNAVLQFEDFNLKHAHPLLNRYRDHHTVFNDDIQASIASHMQGLLRMKGI